MSCFDVFPTLNMGILPSPCYAARIANFSSRLSRTFSMGPVEWAGGKVSLQIEKAKHCSLYLLSRERIIKCLYIL